MIYLLDNFCFELVSWALPFHSSCLLDKLHHCTQKREEIREIFQNASLLETATRGKPLL